MRKFLLSITIVAFVLQLSACQSIRSGGAPEPSFNIDQDLEQLSKEFASATSISEYYKLDADKRQDARNRFDVRFYIVAILFIIFDLEVAFLFP